MVINSINDIWSAVCEECKLKISEIAFDIGFNYTVLEFYSNNVFFTLGLGLIGIYVISRLEKIYHAFKEIRNKVRLNIGCFISSILFIYALGILADEVFRCDYGFSGVLCIVFIYLFRKNWLIGCSLGILMTVLLNNSSLQLYGLFSLLFIMMYNGEKGKSLKYLFYIYYPAHILLITGLSVLFGFRV